MRETAKSHAFYLLFIILKKYFLIHSFFSKDRQILSHEPSKQHDHKNHTVIITVKIYLCTLWKAKENEIYK